MLAIAFVHNGYTEVQISALPVVAVYGKYQQVYVVRFLKYGVLAAMDMDIVYAIVANI